jgi:hypothetical protein
MCLGRAVAATGAKLLIPLLYARRRSDAAFVKMQTLAAIMKTPRCKNPEPIDRMIGEGRPCKKVGKGFMVLKGHVQAEVVLTAKELK